MSTPSEAAQALSRRRWEGTTPESRAAATIPARTAAAQKLAATLDPDLTEDERAAARSAYFRELGKKGAAARWGPSAEEAA